jgi:soluble lytic murein transglycosylase
VRLLAVAGLAAVSLVWAGTRAAGQAPDPDRTCAPPPPASVESLAAAGRYWHASRVAPALPARPPLPAALLQLRIAEALGRSERVGRILAGLSSADTVPEIAAIAARHDERAGRWAAAATRYRRLSALPAATGLQRATAMVRLAIAEEKLRRPDAAAAAWRRAAAALPDLVDWFALRVAAAERDTTRAFALVAHMRTPGAAVARDTFMASRRLAAGNLGGALDLFRRRGLPLRAARVELALGQRLEARQLLDSVLGAEPVRPEAMDAAELLVTRFARLRPDELVSVSRAFRARGRPSTAVRYLRRALTARDTAVAVWLELARAESARSRVSAALAAVDRAAHATARQPEPPAVSLVRVRVLAAAGRWRTAAALVARLVRAFPGDSDAAAAVLLLASHARTTGTREDARPFYHTLLRDFPDAPAANVARFRLAIASYEAGHADSAASSVAAVLARGHGRLARAAGYWAARLAAERHDTRARTQLEAIAAAEPAGYYGVRAHELLGDSGWVAPDSAVPLPPPGSFSPTRARERVRLLAAAGLEAEARAEALAWTQDPGAPTALLLAVARAAEAEGYGREAILLGDAARRRAGLSLEVARALFPFPYRRVIEAEAAEQCVDPLLMAALIRQESRFESAARSRAGARGLSQILPSTGRWMSTRLRLGPWDSRLLQVPDFNLHLGARYLRDRVDRDSLPLHVLLAAYNAGPRRIARWLGWSEYRDPDLFIERLSLAETRDYVRSVYANYEWYRRLYRPAPAGEP